jgi:hypothetical protein
MEQAATNRLGTRDRRRARWRAGLQGAALTALLASPPFTGWLMASTPARAAEPARLELRPGIWFEVVELRRLSEKGIVGLKFAVENRSEETTSLAALGMSDNERRVTDLKLIDFPNGKDYWIGSTGGDCLCSTFPDGAPVPPGERQEFWAWFGAPPAGVTKLAVFVPGVPPLFDVPLAK